MTRQNNPPSRSAATIPSARAVDAPSEETRSFLLKETTGSSFTSRYAA